MINDIQFRSVTPAKYHLIPEGACIRTAHFVPIATTLEGIGGLQVAHPLERSSGIYSRSRWPEYKIKIGVNGKITDMTGEEIL